jgi:ATP-independent RNA helicase DbpA
VLGALTGEAGFAASQVGKINVTDISTYVAVDREIGRQVVSRLSSGRIKGKTVKARLMEGQPG